MMELAGVLIGSIGLTGQLFSGCLTCYRLISTAVQLAKDGNTLCLKLRIEEQRLLKWGGYWDISEGHLDEFLLRQGDFYFRDVVVDTLKKIHSLLLDAIRLSDKYGLRPIGPTNSIQPARSTPTGNPNKTDISTATQEAVSFWKKFRWSIKDSDKFSSLITELGYFNDSLYGLVPPEARRSLSLAVSCETIESTKVSDLKEVGEASTVLQTGTSEQTTNTTSRDRLFALSRSETYDSISDLAALKSFNDSLNDDEPSSSSGSTRSAMKLLIDLSNRKSVQRALKAAGMSPPEGEDVLNLHGRKVMSLESMVGLFSNTLLELKTYDSHLPFQQRMTIYNRMDKLAQFLHSQKPDGFHIPQCIAYAHFEAESTFVFIYKIPDSFKASQNQPMSLYEVISNERPTLLDIASLGSRFQLATRLAVAFLQLHVSGWVHKGFKSSAVKLYPPSLPEPPEGNTKERGSTLVDERLDFTNPQIVGFGYSRPDHPEEMTVERSMEALRTEDQDLYRHPYLITTSVSYRSGLRYQREFDIFSVGLVLFEIGMHKPLRAFWKAQLSPEQFLDRLQRLYLPQLGGKMGNIYKRVVEYCLGAVQEFESVGNLSRQGVRRDPMDVVGIASLDLTGFYTSKSTVSTEESKTSLDDGLSDDEDDDSGEEEAFDRKRKDSLSEFYWNVVLPLEKCKA